VHTSTGVSPRRHAPSLPFYIIVFHALFALLFAIHRIVHCVYEFQSSQCDHDARAHQLGTSTECELWPWHGTFLQADACGCASWSHLTAQKMPSLRAHLELGLY
jgi:hypothetical protein